MSKTHILVPVLCAVLALAACGGTPTATSTSSAVATTTSSVAPVDPAAEQQAVRASFDGYKAAVVAKDGNAAGGLLAETLNSYYVNARDLALTGTEEQVAAAGPSVAVAVYVLRAEYDAATLNAMDPAALVRTAVEKGLIGESSTKNLEIGDITVSGDTAKAEVLSQGKASGVQLSFVKADGTWRVDLRPVLDLADQALTAVAKQQNIPVTQLVDLAMTQKYGADRVAELKKPLKG